MSGIYIKDMKMPKSCFECPMRWKVDPDTIKCLATGERFEETFAGAIEMRNSGRCPLAPVPDHGRLIDADALAKEIEYARFHHSHTDGLAARHHVAEYGHFLNALSEFPAIIPSSKQEVDT